MSWQNNLENGKLFYTILSYDTSVEELINKINTKLEKVNKNMKNNFKKKIINQRIFPILEELKEKKSNEILNIIVLSGNNLNFYNLTKNEISICRKWNLSQFYIDSNEKFKIGYLKNLFNEKNINTIFKLDNMNLQIIELDKVKSRIIKKMILDNDFQNIYNTYKPKLIHGSGSFIKKIKDVKELYTTNLSNNEIIEKINKFEILKNQNLLQSEILNQLQNPNLINKILFGKKEISKGILDYMIKKLFIDKKLLKSLKKNISNDYLNFEIIEINSIENGDIGYQFLKNYDGIIALKYY